MMLRFQKWIHFTGCSIFMIALILESSVYSTNCFLVPPTSQPARNYHRTSNHPSRISKIEKVLPYLPAVTRNNACATDAFKISTSYMNESSYSGHRDGDDANLSRSPLESDVLNQILQTPVGLLTKDQVKDTKYIISQLSSMERWSSNVIGRSSSMKKTSVYTMNNKKMTSQVLDMNSPSQKQDAFMTQELLNRLWREREFLCKERSRTTARYWSSIVNTEMFNMVRVC